MTTRPDVSTAANTGFKAREGYGLYHCVEMVFGSKVRAKPASNPPVPDTAITWSMRGDPSKLYVFSSIDDGSSWQRVAGSGDPIPMGDGKGGSTPWPIGARTTNKKVMLRTIFVDGAPGAVLDSLGVTVNLESGETVTETLSGAALAAGTLLGVKQIGAGVQSTPEIYLNFFANRGALRWLQPVHDGAGEPLGLHLSHGDGAILGVEQQKDNAARYERASMAGDVWIRPTSNTGTIMGWATNQGPSPTERLGLRLYLTQTSAGVSSQLHLEVFELIPTLIGRGTQTVQTHQRILDSPPGAIRLHAWNHVAFSFDGFWMNLYINAVLVARFALRSQYNFATEVRRTRIVQADGTVIGKRKKIKIPIGQVIPTDGAFVVGRHPVAAQNQSPANLQNSYGGDMSELRLYSKPLTIGTLIQRMRRRISNAAEIAQMKAQDGLVALYGLNQGFGTAALDLTGNNNHLLFDQQLVLNQFLRHQLGWRPDATSFWRGYPLRMIEIKDGIEVVDYHPGRQGLPLPLDTAGDVLRVTTADHDITFPDGRVFVGVGHLGEISMVQEPADLVPTGAELQLSGVAPQNVSLAMRADYLDRQVTIWLTLFDQVNAFVADPIVVFDGRMDKLDVALDAESASCVMTAESHLRNWSSAGHQRWNHQAQLVATNGEDHGLEFLAEMVDKEVWWPARVKSETSAPPTG